MIQKKLTAFVTLNEEKDCASIEIKNDQGTTVLGPLTHHALSTKIDPSVAINEHIMQLKSRGLNITAIRSNMPGIM